MTLWFQIGTALVGTLIIMVVCRVLWPPIGRKKGRPTVMICRNNGIVGVVSWASYQRAIQQISEREAGECRPVVWPIYQFVEGYRPAEIERLLAGCVVVPAHFELSKNKEWVDDHFPHTNTLADAMEEIHGIPKPKSPERHHLWG